MTESPDDREAGGAGAVVRLPADVTRSSRLLVRLTAPRFRSLDDFVVEAVRDLLDEIERSDLRPPGHGRAARTAARPVSNGSRSTRRGPRDPVRVKAMYERYLEGRTLQEVGDEFGVTRERVRQLFVSAGYAQRGAGERRDVRVAADDLRADEVVAAYRELGNVNEVAARVGMSADRVRGLLARQGVDLRAHRRDRRGGWQRYRDEEIRDCVLRASAEEDNLRRGILTAQVYERYRRGRTLPDGRPWPSSQTVAGRFGSWRAALEGVGLPSNPPSPVAGKRRFDEDACVEAVREVRRLLGRLPSADEYSQLASRLDGLPSVATIRHVVGSWQQALRLAGP